MALPRRRVIPVKKASNRPAAKTNSKKKLARRRVVPIKRTAKKEAEYRAMQKKPKRGIIKDDLNLKADAVRPPRIEKPKEEISYALSPREKYAVKPGDPNYRDRGARGGSKTLPFTRPMTPPEQQKMRNLQKAAKPTSSKLPRRRALPVGSGTIKRKMPTPNPYGTPQFGANMQPIGRASEYEIARYEAEQAMKRGLEPIPSGYVFANPRLDPNYAPPPMTPPQQDMLRRLFSSYNNAVNTGNTRPLSKKQYNNIFGSMFGRRP